jgi:hypothetical protein
MRKTLESDALQGSLEGCLRIENDGSRMHRLRQAGSAEESVASLRFATRFDSDWSSFEHLQRDVKERCRVAALELKLDLADRLNATAIGSPNVSHVDCGLNSSGRLRLELDYRPRDRRRKERTQTLLTD